MTLNFPPTPEVGDPYESGGKTWIWNGVSWVLQGPDAPVIPPQIEVDPNGPVPSLTIDADGHVGVGTQSPNFNLSVKGTLDSLFEVQSSANNRILIEANASGANNIYTRNGGNSYADLRFVSGTDREAFRINTQGRMGIGCTNPGYRLDVASDDSVANQGYAVRIRSNSTSTYGGLQFTNSAASAQTAAIKAADTGFLYLDANGGTSFQLSEECTTNKSFRTGYKSIPNNAAWALNETNTWECPSATVINPSNVTAGMTGVIVLNVQVTSWGSFFKFPGGSAPSGYSTPAVVPYIAVSTNVILVGNIAEGIT